VPGASVAPGIPSVLDALAALALNASANSTLIELHQLDWGFPVPRRMQHETIPQVT